MTWIRKCPLCHKDIFCADRGMLYRKSTKNRACRDCWKVRVKSNRTELIRKCPSCQKIINYSTYKIFWIANKKNQKCRKCSKLKNIGRRGQKCSADHKRKVGMAHKGKIISPEAKHKMRLAAIKRMDALGITQYRNYNPLACQYFDELNVQKQWNLQHAKNGGEVQIRGYFVDAYDKEKNIVVEYDEPRHDSISHRKKDEIRQAEIISYLKCKFYRYKESSRKLILI